MKTYQFNGGRNGCGSVRLFETHDEKHYNRLIKKVKRHAKAMGYVNQSETIVIYPDSVSPFTVINRDVERRIMSESNR